MERAVLPMARAALDAGQVETARRLYRRVLQVDSDSVDARMGLGDAAVASRESAEAARWYLAALANARRPDERHAALLAHGRAALSAGQLEAARKSFARLTEPDERAPEAVVAWGFNGLGLTLLLAGDVRGGVAAMEQAVLRAPDDVRFQGNLTRALAMLTEFDDPSSDTSATDPVARARAEMLPMELLPAGVEPIPSPPGSPQPASPEAPARAEPVAVEDRTLPRDRPLPRPRDTPTPVAVADEAEFPDVAVPRHGEAPEPAARTLPEPPAQVATTDAPTDLPDTEAPPAPVAPVVTQAALPADPAGEADLPTTSEQEPVVLKEDAWTIVQPAAYASRSRAERLSERLRELTDHPVWVSEGRAPGGEMLSRVRIGPVPSRAALVALSATLEAEGFGPLSLPAPAGETGPPAGAPPLLVTTDGERYVQAGAYAVKAAAEELAERLAQLTRHRAGVSEATLPGGQRVYRVRVGPIEPGQALDELADALEVHGYGRVETLREPRAQRPPSARRDAPPIIVREAGRRFVQTAAYATAQAAEEAADRVRVIVDPPVRIDEAQADGDRLLYRVRVGPVPSYEELVGVADALEVAGYGVMTIPPPGEADPAAGRFQAADTGVTSPPRTSPALTPPPLVLREGGERFLQAGAYAARATAEALATQLRERVPPPVRVTETVHADGRALYRVRVGPIGSETPLASLVEAIEAARRIGD